ncbi:unnamed protein product [Mytilus coruscus]|uniref:Uncharacterized protein n=1 Tax=Mytilus coruscus TaxID=42192 RepID=A0A6J8BZR8_MYTCO|nr:unnamed protein product [Mytilus coruscus]
MTKYGFDLSSRIDRDGYRHELQTIANDEKESEKAVLEISAPTIAYNSPVKGRATTTVQTLKDEQIQTWRVEDNEQGESEADECRMCGILVMHESEKDMRVIPSGWGVILKFKKGKDKWEDCNYWVHGKCVGIYVKRWSKKGKCARRFSVSYVHFMPGP